MSLFAVIVFLAILGFAAGFLLAVTLKKRRSVLPERPEKLSEAQLRRLNQLKSQLESGLLTKEEYEAKRQELLNQL